VVHRCTMRGGGGECVRVHRCTMTGECEQCRDAASGQGGGRGSGAQYRCTTSNYEQTGRPRSEEDGAVVYRYYEQTERPRLEEGPHGLLVRAVDHALGHHLELGLVPVAGAHVLQVVQHLEIAVVALVAKLVARETKNDRRTGSYTRTSACVGRWVWG